MERKRPPVDPERLGPYELLEQAGRGGAGKVFRVRHVQTGSIYALKLLVQRSERSMGRFEREIDALTRLDHRNVVRVHACGATDEGFPWIVFDWLDGASLAEHIQRGPLPPDDAARVVADAGRAVEQAHRVGVLHRDLKPGNVMLAEDGSTRVIDFGLALPWEESTERMTRTGELAGTPAFMAPEQVCGHLPDGPDQLGPWTDVYGLGTVLYTALTGRPPFEAATALALVGAVVRGGPTPPRVLRPEIPEELESICLKALRREPPDRYASAAALAEDLDRFRAGEPVLATNPGNARRLFSHLRSGRRLAVVALGAACLGLLALALAPSTKLLGPSPAEELAHLERTLTRRGRLDPSEREELAELAAGLSGPATARARWLVTLVDALDEQGDAAQRLARIVRPRGAIDATLLRETTAVLVREKRTDTLALILHGESPEAPTPTDAARTVAIAVAEGTATAPTDGTALAALIDAPGLSRAQRGRVLTAHAMRLAEGSSPDLPAALAAFERAAEHHRTLPEPGSWPDELLELARVQLIDRLRTSDPRARISEDLLVAAGRGDEPIEEADIRPLQEWLVTTFSMAHRLPANEEERDALFDQGLLVVEYLERHGHSGVPHFNVELVTDQTGLDYLLDRARSAIEAEPARPAELVVLARVLLHLKRRPSFTDRADVGRRLDAAAERLASAAAGAPLDSRWFHVLRSATLSDLGDFEAARIASQIALEHDRRFPLAERWPTVAFDWLDATWREWHRLGWRRGRVTNQMIRDRWPLQLAVAEEAWTVQRAVDPKLARLREENVVLELPWSLDRRTLLSQGVRNALGHVLRRGAKTSCAGGCQPVERLIELNIAMRGSLYNHVLEVDHANAHDRSEQAHAKLDWILARADERYDAWTIIAARERRAKILRRLGREAEAAEDEAVAARLRRQPNATRESLGR